MVDLHPFMANSLAMSTVGIICPGARKGKKKICSVSLAILCALCRRGFVVGHYIYIGKIGQINNGKKIYVCFVLFIICYSKDKEVVKRPRGNN